MSRCRPEFILNLLACIFLFLTLVPLVWVLSLSFFSDGRFSLEMYQSVFGSPKLFALFANSLVLAGLTTIFSLLLGLPLGILMGKTDLPFRNLFLFLFLIPFLIPPYITALSWLHILGKEGVLAFLLGPRVGEITSNWLFGWPGGVLVLTTVFLPIIILITTFSIRSINPHVEEAARCFASWPSVLKSVSLPLIAPNIFVAATVVFLLSFGELTVPMFLRLNVFPVESFTEFSAFYDFRKSTAFSVPVLILALVILMIEQFGSKRTVNWLLPPTVTEKEKLVINLSRFKWLIFGGAAVIVGILILLPFCILLWESASWKYYLEAFQIAGDSLYRSFLFSGIGATILLLLGIFLGYLYQKKFSFVLRFVNLTALFAFILPSTVIGLGLIYFWNQPKMSLVYTTPVILIMGYLVQYFLIPYQFSASLFKQIPISLEEAAQNTGTGLLGRIFFILVPMIKRGLLSLWLLSFILCFRDTGLAMILYPPGNDTFPVRIFTMMANSPSQLIAALCGLLILGIIIPWTLIYWQWKKEGAYDRG